MSNLFKDIIPSLTTTKKYCLENEKDYVPYTVNKAMSYYDDCLFYAAEMNRFPDLSKTMQYDFYFHALKGRRRHFVKWDKPIKEDQLELVKQYFGYNDTKARDALRILNNEQLEMIRLALTVGVNDE